MIRITNLTKVYEGPDRTPVVALRLADFTVPQGGRLAVTGPSGSGKSTFLAILGGALTATTGRMLWDGQPWGRADGADGARERARRVGFVFQELNLLPSLTVEDNLRTASWLLGAPVRDRDIAALLDRVGLGGRRRHKPGQLSRGEQQRAAVARAMLHPHPLVIADEPTASLDEENALLVAGLLVEMSEANGGALVVATHDPRIMALLPSRLELASNKGCT